MLARMHGVPSTIVASLPKGDTITLVPVRYRVGVIISPRLILNVVKSAVTCRLCVLFGGKIIIPRKVPLIIRKTDVIDTLDLDVSIWGSRASVGWSVGWSVFTIPGIAHVLFRVVV